MSRKPVKKRSTARPVNTELTDQQLLADAERQLQKYLSEKGSRIVGNPKQM
jgi:hypothetical protein